MPQETNKLNRLTDARSTDNTVTLPAANGEGNAPIKTQLAHDIPGGVG